MSQIIISKKATSMDVLCVVLARYGFSYKLIQARTGLSFGQISLRLKQSGTQVKDFRNGESRLAQQVIDTVDEGTQQYLKEIKKQLALKM